MLSLSKNNQYRIAVEKWTIDIASLWKLTIVEVFAIKYEKLTIFWFSHLDPQSKDQTTTNMYYHKTHYFRQFYQGQ